MKTVIHVNQHVIKRNARDGTTEPVLTVKTYKSNDYGKRATIYGADGVVAATVVYRPEKPLACGARVWIEVADRKNVVLE